MSGGSRKTLDRRRLNKLRRKKAGLADIATGFCMNGLAEACGQWRDDVKKELGGEGFGSMFDIKRPHRFSRKLALHLMLKMDHASMEIDFGDGRKLKLTKEYMAHATGLPDKGARVVAPNPERRRLLLKKVHRVLKTGTKETQLPSIETLIKNLERSK